MSFLKAQKDRILDGNGQRVVLKGVNFGGWLMMEGYILHALNLPVAKFKKEFADHLGAATLKEFEEVFYTHFISEADFSRCAILGFNCIRLPFHHALVEREPFRYDGDGLRYLDQAIAWAKKYKLWIILDLPLLMFPQPDELFDQCIFMARHFFTRHAATPQGVWHSR